MKLIKRLTQGNRTLEHHTYIDDYGFKRDAFEIIETQANGHRIARPFLPPVKVQARTSRNVRDQTTEYTDEDYQQMLNHTSV